MDRKEESGGTSILDQIRFLVYTPRVSILSSIFDKEVSRKYLYV